MSKLIDALIAYKRQKMKIKESKVTEIEHWSTSVLRGLVFPEVVFEQLDVKRFSSQFSAVACVGFQNLIADYDQQIKNKIFYIPSTQRSKRHACLLESLIGFNTFLESVITKKIIHLRNLLTIKNLSISA